MFNLNRNLSYGIISGISLSLWFLLEFIFGFKTYLLHIGKYSRYFAFLIPVIAVYFAIRQLKISNNKASFFILEGIKSSIIISLVCVLIAFPFLHLYSNYMNTPWIANAVDLHREESTPSELSEEDLEIHGEQLQNIIQNDDRLFEILIFIPLLSVLSGVFFTLFIKRHD
jgi:hypothetical protein